MSKEVIDGLLAALDRLVISYLSYRAGRLSASVEQAAQIKDTMYEVIKIREEIAAGNCADVDEYFHNKLHVKPDDK